MSIPARLQPQELPDEPTSFVGRRSEVASLSEAVAAHRLVTVTGVGGVGKTRLALRVARHLAGSYPGGVCLVELSALKVPALLPSTVVSALGLAPREASVALDAVTAHLREQPVLLILDTCEYLAGTCGEFARTITREAPGVTVLATSRQPLGVAGEEVFQLDPLPVPSPGGRLSPGDAADLFVQRARSAAPGFRVDDGNRSEVVAICQRLAGLPLALELAAARLRTLSLRDLVEGFVLDMTDDADTGEVPRHRDLRSAIGWSYQLCTEAERTLWRRLSVFAGSISMNAAVAVCAVGTDSLDEDAIADAADGLIRKSVLVEDPASAGDVGKEVRYRLLDPIREFGAAELNASGAGDAVRGAYIAHYLSMAREFGRNAVSADQLSRCAELRSEHANIRGAMEYAFATEGNDRAAIDIATSIFLYWHMTGIAWEGEYWVNRSLERCPRPCVLRAQLLAVRAYLLAELGEVQMAREDAIAAVKMGERFGDTGTVARGYASLHRVLTWSDDLAGASAIADTTLSLLEAEGDTLDLARFDMHAAFGYLQARDLAGVEETTARGLRRLPVGELWANGYLLGVRGFARFLAGEEEGAALLRRAAAMKHELGDVVGIAYCVGGLGLMAIGQERHERAVWLLGAAEALWNQAGRRYAGNIYLEEWHRQATTAARKQLGDERYEQLWASGVAAGPDALALVAVADADAPVTGPA
ncbi:MAG: LuxR family transcriptional regulator, partial [Nocardiopsaceae bacterium]|nr:LuxR family transcriptional regulator [Nocardiopsaceae bacterium]